jgi:hypothetical protein
MELDSTYNIKQNLDKTAKRVSEAAQDLDQQLSFSRRVKNAANDFNRKAPAWRRQFGEFSSTSGGKATLLVAFVALLMSGTLWQLLNLVWLIWWVSVPVGLYMANENRKQQQERQQQQGSSNDNSSNFGSNFSSSGYYGRSGSNPLSKKYSQGPVVDAQWVSLDDDGSPRKK